MIIEAGYDLFELFAPKLFAKRGPQHEAMIQRNWERYNSDEAAES